MVTAVFRGKSSKDGQIAYRPYFLLNWMAPTHAAHATFKHQMKISDAELLRSTLDWKTKSITMKGMTFGPEIGIVGEKFFNECTEQRLLDTKAGRRSGCPPAALAFNLYANS
jgi:hypothetical protein